MYKNAFFVEPTSYDVKGWPVGTDFFKFYTAGISNVSFTCKVNVNSSPNKADDLSEPGDETITDLSLTFSALGIDPKARAIILGETEDVEGQDYTLKAGYVRKPLCCVYEMKDKKGVPCQRWIYNVIPSMEHTDSANQPGSEQDQSFTATGTALVLADGTMVFYHDVYKGSPNWVEGTPTKIVVGETA